MINYTTIQAINFPLSLLALIFGAYFYNKGMCVECVIILCTIFICSYLSDLKGELNGKL